MDRICLLVVVFALHTRHFNNEYFIFKRGTLVTNLNTVDINNRL